MQMKTFAKVLRPLLTALEYVIAILIVAVTTQFFFGNTLESWIITSVSVALSVSTFLIWYSDGIDRGENVPKVYNTVLRYNVYSKYILSLQDFDALRDFVEKKNKEYELDLLSAKLGEQELTLENLNKFKELRQIALETAITRPKWQIGKLSIGKKLEINNEDYLKLIKRYSKKQLKTLMICTTKKVRFKHLRVKDILRASDKSKGLVPVNTEKTVVPGKVVFKIVWGATVGLFTAYVVFTRKVWGVTETIQAITWIFSISLNIFNSIRSGYKAVTVDRYNFYKAKAELCSEFFAFKGVKIETIEKETNIFESMLKEKTKSTDKKEG